MVCYARRACTEPSYFRFAHRIVMAVNEEQFRTLNVDQMWELYSKAAVDRVSFDKLATSVSDTLTKLQACEKKIVELDSELSISKAVSDALRISMLENGKRINELDQYSRRENVVIKGIPEDMSESEAEEKFEATLHAVNVEVSNSDICAFHRLKKKSMRIVRFTNRRIAEKVVRSGKDIGEDNLSNIWGSNLIQFFPNLTAKNMKIRFLAKNLKALEAIEGFGFNEENPNRPPRRPYSVSSSWHVDV